MMRALLVVALAAGPARADDSVTKSTEPATGPALGVEAGDPTSVTAAWLGRGFGVDAAIGSGTLAGPGLSLHADVLAVVHHLAPAMPLIVGLGVRWYHHGYQPMSIDEVPDSHVGIRAPIAVGWQTGRVLVYAEVAPGIDVMRTRSCTLADGPDSICPHAMERPLFLDFAVGVRWFFRR